MRAWARTHPSGPCLGGAHPTSTVGSLASLVRIPFYIGRFSCLSPIAITSSSPPLPALSFPSNRERSTPRVSSPSRADRRRPPLSAVAASRAFLLLPLPASIVCSSSPLPARPEGSAGADRSSPAFLPAASISSLDHWRRRREQERGPARGAAVLRLLFVGSRLALVITPFAEC